MVELILLITAILGGLVTLYGNYRVVRGSDCDRPILRFILLCLIPLTNLMILVRHYRRVKIGSFIAIAGMWLTVPYFGVKLWEKQDTMKRRTEERKKEFARRTDQLDDESDTGNPGGAGGDPDQQSQRLGEKEKLVAQLNARLSWWFQQLQQRRATLAPGDETALQSFNEEAAAYTSLNAVAREKNAELLTLRSVVKR